MNNLNTYINEKLKINSKTKITDDWSIQNAKNGDIIYCLTNILFIYKGLDINKKYTNNPNGIIYHALCDDYNNLSIGPSIGIGTINDNNTYHYKLASNEQCKKMFNILKSHGYKWDESKLELEKI